MLANIDASPFEDRQLSAGTMLLDEETVAKLKLQLHSIVDQAAHLADSRPTNAPVRVYQLALQLLPVSGRLTDP